MATQLAQMDVNQDQSNAMNRPAGNKLPAQKGATLGNNTTKGPLKQVIKDLMHKKNQLEQTAEGKVNEGQGTSNIIDQLHQQNILYNLQE